jgi:BMFP domain-containing protein YqiC
MAKDFISALKVYVQKVADGERSPAEVVASVKTWLRESGESVKSKVEEEVEKSVSKMGFVKREEVDRLKSELNQMRSTISSGEEKVVKKVIKKAPSKKAPAKKASVKKVVKK